MAKFKFRHAVMTAGKSQELARVHYNYRIKGEKILVIVPSTDTRNGVGTISARSGERLEAQAIVPGTLRTWLTEYFDKSALSDEIVCILSDETQFFTSDDINALKILAVIDRDIPVIAYGLKNDFKNELFEGSAACIAMAEKIEEIETICAFCNKRATMNLRFNMGQPVRSGQQVLIGDEEYRPVCHYHYLQDDLVI